MAAHARGTHAAPRQKLNRSRPVKPPQDSPHGSPRGSKAGNAAAAEATMSEASKTILRKVALL
jgi:hypothetical protein